MPRRQCPGKKLGLSNVRLFIMTLLAAFDILPMEDENGKLTLPAPEFLNGVSRSVYLSILATRNGPIMMYRTVIPNASQFASGHAPTRLFRSSARCRHSQLKVKQVVV
jgi:hypothetical protein